MKRKPIDLQEDASDIKACIGLFFLLEGWVPSAEEILDDLTTTLEEDCCGSCGLFLGKCRCQYESIFFHDDYDHYEDQ